MYQWSSSLHSDVLNSVSHADYSHYMWPRSFARCSCRASSQLTFSTISDVPFQPDFLSCEWPCDNTYCSYAWCSTYLKPEVALNIRVALASSLHRNLIWQTHRRQLHCIAQQMRPGSWLTAAEGFALSGSCISTALMQNPAESVHLFMCQMSHQCKRVSVQCRNLKALWFKLFSLFKCYLHTWLFKNLHNYYNWIHTGNSLNSWHPAEYTGWKEHRSIARD